MGALECLVLTDRPASSVSRLRCTVRQLRQSLYSICKGVAGVMLAVLTVIPAYMQYLCCYAGVVAVVCFDFCSFEREMCRFA